MNSPSSDSTTNCLGMRYARLFIFAMLCCLGSVSATTWSGDGGPWGTGPMNDCVNTWNTYAYYGFNIPVYYNSGIPTAQADYRGSIGFGGQGNYRVCMHESSHWIGTGTTGQWDLHQRYSIWNGTYAVNLRRAYDGPGERQFIYGVHYGPQGANYDSEGVQAPQMVGVVGAFRRDQDLEFGDQTIGIAPGTYRLRQRVSVKMLDNAGITAEGAQARQSENVAGNGQLWNVNLILGTRYFTLQNVAGGKYLDSLGATTDNAPVGLTSLVGGTPTDNQLWQVVQTDSFFFKIINKANGKALDNLGLTADGSGVAQYASGSSWNQQWTFLHPLAQLAPPAGVISQGRWVSSSSTDGGNYDTKGNNGVSGDRWTASSGSFPQWWRVDTGMVQPITKVEIDWFATGAPTFQYRIEVSDNDANWTVAADRTSNTVTGTTVDHFIASGRFVRVVVTGASAGWAAFHECRVYNEAQPMTLLSQQRPVSASSEQNGNLAVNANDVDPVFTRWCSNSPGYPAWWQVDLGTPQQVNRAVTQWFDDDGRSYQYRIEGSTDGVNYTTLVDRTDNNIASMTADNFSGIARYVRIHVTGGSSSYPSIYEAQVYGATTPLPPFAPSLTATGAASQINLTWPSVGGVTSYTVKRAITSGGPYTTLTTTSGTIYNDTAIVAGIPYYYVVSATNGIGTSANSTEAAAAAGGELRTYLPFNETTGTIAGDASGFVKTGTLVNGPTWVAGNIANAVNFDGIDDHVTLPSGVVSTLNDFTIATWVNPTVNSTWARLFDFGTGTTNYMFLAPSNGTSVRFAIRTAAVAEQQLTSTALPAGTWSHVAVTLSGNTGTLYVNGVAVATNNSMTLKPSSLGITTNNYLGRSQFADPYLNGKVDDFRIYSRALGVAEIGKLRGITAPSAPASVVAQAGDTKVILSWSPSLGATSYKVKSATTAGGPYTLVATVGSASYVNTGLTNGTPCYYVISAVNAANESADSSQASATPFASPPIGPAAPAVLIPYEIGMQVKLAWSASVGATSYNLKRATVSGGPYATIAAPGTTNYTDSTVTPGNTYYYVVSAVSATEGANSTQASALPNLPVSAAYLKMDETSGTTTADESGNGLTGTLVNGPTRATGRIDRAISFDGTNDHVTLPTGATGTMSDCTLSVWVRPTALAEFARVFDFGTGTTNYMFLTLKSSTGKPRFAIRTPSTGEQVIESSVAVALNVWSHIAVTISGDNGTLYINGAVVGGNGTMALNPSSLGSTTLNCLGRSQFPADPYFAGLMDEFQIRSRALTITEIAALASPPNAPTGLAATGGGQQVSLAWNPVANATGYTVRRATVSGGPYTVIASNVVSPGYIDTGLTGGTTYYYVATAQKLLADSPVSAQASAATSPLTPAQTWRQTWFGTTADTGSAADSEDPDHDGVKNLLERAFGGNPTAVDPGILPAIDPASPLLSILYTRATGFSDLALTVQESSDESMDSWITAVGTETVTDLGSTERVKFTAAPGSAGRRFLRLQAIQTP